MTLGGRAAEEIVFSEITTGAANDLEKVTETAKQMVMRFGMSERLGPRIFGHDHSMPFLGREFTAEPDYSDEIAREIDDEIRRIVEEAHQTREGHAGRAPRRPRPALEAAARARDDRREQFEALLAGESAEEVFGARGGRAHAAAEPSPSRSAARPRGPAPDAAPAPRPRRRLRGDARRPPRVTPGTRAR